MLKRISVEAVLAFAMLFSCAVASAQDGAYLGYTPYSIFGVGDLMDQGSAFTKSMGGVGVATRNNRFINPVNPAAITARDSLSFMIDFSLMQNNRFISQGGTKSVNNTFNVNDCIITFPIYRSLTVMLGIGPYSATGYSYSAYYTDKEAPIAKTGNIGYAFIGSGNTYQLFAATAASFFKDRLSVGAEWMHYFGKVDKSSALVFYDETYAGNSTETFLSLKGDSFKFGLQYTQPLPGKSSLTFGATYKMKARMKGTALDYGLTDTSTVNIFDKKAYFADEMGFGVSFVSNDKFRAEVNCSFSDWPKSGIENVIGMALDNSGYSTGSTFSTTKASSFNVGVEYTPNRTDVRYFLRRCSYRAGAYYKTDYFKVDGNAIASAGITLGATLPVFRWSNGITLAAEFGQRASKKNNLVRERYVNFSIGFNLYDIWFRKMKYE